MNRFKRSVHIPRNVWFIVCFSLLLHVGSLFVVLNSAGSKRLVYGDAKGYIELAKNIKSGAGFVTIVDGRSQPEVFRSPGLPVLLVPFVKNDSFLIIYLFLQSLLASFFIPIFVWKITSELFDSHVGLVATWLVAVEPLFLFFSWFPLTEVPFVIFSLSGFLFFQNIWKFHTVLSATLAGLFMAAAVYIRPGNILLFLTTLFIVTVYVFLNQRKNFLLITITVVALFAALLPWYIRTYHVTGEFALAGTGWRNVYTDYLASVRSLNKGTTFWDEKEKLKEEALPRFGVSRADLGNPKYAHILRDASIKEIVESPLTVMKLQSMLYVSFFTNDGWYSYLRRVELLPEAPRSSATMAVLTEGWRGMIRILNEMRDQFFIPVIGRLYVVLIVIFALVYVVFSRQKVAYLISFILFLSATASSVIGLGVEARLRVSVLPFLLMLSAGGVVFVYNFFFLNKRKAVRQIIKSVEKSGSVKTLTVAIPAYNEALIINQTIHDIDDILSKIPGLEYKIIVANNGSTDNTEEVVEKSGVACASVFSVKGKGKGLAVREVSHIAQSDVFAFCDADLSADPSILPVMLKHIEAGADIVIGSRLINQKMVNRGFFRTVSSLFFNMMRKVLIGINVTDSQCGLKVFRKEVLPIIQAGHEVGWFFDMEILAMAEHRNFSIVEVPVSWVEFRYSNRKSKLKVIRDGFGAILAMLRISRRIVKNNKVV